MSCASKMSLTVKITYIGSQLVELYNGTKDLDVGSEQIICKWGKKHCTHIIMQITGYTQHKGIPLLKYLEHPS